jgi:DNA-binding beta-propeller fold protein YncE
MLGALLIYAAPASATGQRQHVFGFSFGSLGTGGAQFFHPSGVAVSGATGNVYVADRENNRLEEFKPVLGTGGEVVGETFVKAVSVEFPEAVAVDNCTKASSPEYEACDEGEDPSVGDVYVATAKKGNKAKLGEDEYVYKFNANLEELSWSKKFKEDVYGLAVNHSGGLFVYGGEGKITAFSDAAENGLLAGQSVTSAAKGEATRAFAIESRGNFYAGVLADVEEAPEKTPLSELFHELANEGVGLIAKLAASNGRVLMHDLDYEEARAVAVNPSDVPANGVDEEDDTYVAEVANVAGGQSSTIAAFGPAEGGGAPAEGEGQLLQRFSAAGLKEADGIAVDPRTGNVFVSDGASNRVAVFELEPPGKPAVTSVDAQSIEPPPTASNATSLSAQVSPAGSPTRYYFEYGTSSCSASSCQATAPASLAGEGFGDQQVTVELLSLPPGAYDYRLVAENAHGRTESGERTFDIADSLGALPDGRAWELVSPPNKDGAEPEAPTLEGASIEASANGDAITYVADGPMPAEGTPEGSRSPEYTQILSTRALVGGQPEWATRDINTPNATGAGTDAGAPPEYELFSNSLALALVEPFPGAAGSLASPPLSPPVGDETEAKREQENTPYVRDDEPLHPEASEEKDYEQAQKHGESMDNAGFIALVTKLDEPGPEFGHEPQGIGIVVAGATPDLSHVVLNSEKAGKGLYEWTGDGLETLQAVSLLPGSKEVLPTPEAGLGAVNVEGGGVRHAISNNGALVFWTRSFHEGSHLYVRDTQLQNPETHEPAPETLELTQPGEAEAVFQTANAEGSKVYFTDTQRLTPDSEAAKGSPNLYVAELSVVDEHLQSRITDLTPQADPGLLPPNSDAVVIAASEEEEAGAYVYFVADAALAAGATRGHCFTEIGERRPAGTTCNLYVRHYDIAAREWEPTQLVAALSAEDLPDWDADQKDPQFLTSRASPNGRYLAFMSNRSLTGYDNEDVSGQGRRDEEVFLYDAQQQTVVCASCNPSGARPTGVLDTEVDDNEGLGLVVDRGGVWAAKRGFGADPWLAASIPGYQPLEDDRAVYQSRYLSNTGRLFFNSADALLPVGSVINEKRTKIEKTVDFGELEVGVENVYEYEPTEVGGCQSGGGCIGLISSGKSEHESVFLDASESGNDVFFLTAERLAPQDTDSNFDVYDAHVCEGGSSCPPAANPPKEPCDSEACQGIPAAPPTLLAPASLSFSGSGNVVLPKQAVLPEKKAAPPAKRLTRAQKLAKALKACKKDKKKSKRLACDKQARKKYGPIKKKTSSKAKK